MRSIEREWWLELTHKCKGVGYKGRIGDMHECLRKFGKKEVSTAENNMISRSEFKNHFESVSKEWYEKDASLLVSVSEKVEDMRKDGRAIDWDPSGGGNFESDE